MSSYSQDFPFGIMDVVELLHLRVRRRQANSVYVDCPFCGDLRGKMNVNYIKNVWRCNYCDEHGGMLSLYARYHQITNSDAYREICDALQAGETSWGYEEKGMPVAETEKAEVSAAAQTFRKEQGILEETEQSPRASDQEIHQTLSLLLGMLSLKPNHRAHLCSEKRGLTDEQIQECGFKSTPPFFLCRTLTERLIRQGCTVAGVPGFYMDEHGQWTVKFGSRTSGILIPAVGIDGLIRGAQILLDVPLKNPGDSPEKTGAKYIWLSSSTKYMGVTSGSPVHFIGNPFARTIYVTEGLLKADIAHFLMNRSFVAIAGANNAAQLESLFALLAQNGTELIVEAHDMDKYNNEMTAKGSSKIYLYARQLGINCRRLTWNPNYKGIDDWQLALRQKEHRKNPERKELSEEESSRQAFRIYQLELGEGVQTIPFAFLGIESLHKAGYKQPPADKYRLVCEMEVLYPKKYGETERLQYLKTYYQGLVPQDYQGRPLAPSDIVELYGKEGRRYFYVNTEGFELVRFSPFLAKPLTQNKMGPM